MKLLIVEDQKYPLEALEEAVRKVVPRFHPEFKPTDCNVAKSYEAAQKWIRGNHYNYVLLDHRIPRQDVGDLENRDFDAFSDSLREIGYLLIPEIKEKEQSTIVIGTSSLSQEELRRFAKPDFTMRKSFDYAEADLEKILRQITGAQ